MQSDRSRPWFPVKRYGWGWEVTWQGLVALCTYIAVLIVAFKVLGGTAGIIVTTIATAAFLLVMWRKADERPLKWRWGERDEDI